MIIYIYFEQNKAKQIIKRLSVTKGVMENKYTKRLVGAKDTRMCTICHKPTTTVLYNGSGPDWIYCCPLHLVDNPQLATPMYDEEYGKVVDELKVVKSQLDSVSSGRKGGSGGNWDVWVTSIFNNRKRQDADKEGTDGDTQQSVKNMEAAKEDEEVNVVALKQKYDSLLDKMHALQKGNKQYQLHDKMFQYRVQRLQQQAVAQKKHKQEQQRYTNTTVDELQNKLKFPEVPRNPPAKHQ